MGTITPVNIGALFGIVDDARRNRLQEMVLGKQIAKLDADAAADAGFRSATETAFQRTNPWGNVTLTKGDAGATAPVGAEPVQQGPDARTSPADASVPAGFSGTTPPASGPANLLPAMYAPSLAPDASPTPPPPNGVPSVNWDGITQMMHYKPKETLEILKNLGEMNDTQIKRADARAGALGVAAKAIMGVPGDDPRARAAELERWAPYLREHGITDEQISSADLTDAGLSRQFAKSFDFKAMIEKEKSDRDFAATQADRAADNARADSALSETRRNHRVTESQGGQRIAISRANAGEVSPSKVMGPILAKISQSGMKSLTPSEAEAFNAYKSFGIVDQALGRGAPVGDEGDDGSVTLPAPTETGPIIPSAARRPLSASPVRVRSIAEARALPKGTEFLTPDGQHKVR